jgi:serine phosphatase RsbU (regulator of sigma subunit)
VKRVSVIGLAHALAGAGSVDEVHEAIQRGLPTILDAAAANLWIVDQDAGELWMRQSATVPTMVPEHYQRLRLDTQNPITEVVRTGSLLVLPDHDAWRAHAPAELIDDIGGLAHVTAAIVPLVDSAGAVVAAMAVSWAGVVELDEPAIATIHSVAELCEQSLERAWATDQAAERATNLAALATQLADALTVEDVLEVVTSSGASPVDAVATSIGLIDHVAWVLRTHHGRTVDEETRRRYTDPSLDAALAFTDAARTGQAIFVEDYDAYLARYPGAGPATAGLGLGARAAIPIRTSGGGVTIGSIVHAWAGPRTFDAGLVSTLTTIANMAGQAVERARLLEQVRRDAAHHEMMAALAELLATARSGDDVAEIVTRHGAATAGADSANVAILESSGDVLRVHHHPSLAADIQGRYPSIPRGASLPHADVLRGGEVMVFGDLEAFGARYPGLVDDLVQAGRQACAVAALQDAAGHPLGALGLAWSEPQRFDDATLATIRGVARLCAQALERAQLSDAEHRLVNTLQESVLTPLPDLPGLSITGCYLPAARHIGMGGDWYEGIVLDDHRYALVVGDVAGHGITAIGGMAQLQAVIGALVRLGMPLGEVFPQTTTLLRREERTTTATALLVVVDVQACTLSYVAAGHPPPLVRGPDGATTVLEDGRQPLLGVRLDAEPVVGTHPFPPGSVVVAYTDGLVERRREPIDRCIERLVDHLRAAPDVDADGIAKRLMDAAIGDREPDDDVAMVVLGHEPR